MSIPPFQPIYDAAVARKGGVEALEQALTQPKSRDEVLSIPDDRWLSAMAKCVFQAGFSWTVIKTKWPAFEQAFYGFDVGRILFYHDEDMDRLLADKGIVRNGQKIQSVLDNARFIADVSGELGSFSTYIADWPQDDLSGLYLDIAKRGARLGGATGQRLLRMMGVSTYVLSVDVLKRLSAEGIADKAPTSKKAWSNVQAAFNAWADETGRPFTQISQIMAHSVD